MAAETEQVARAGVDGVDGAVTARRPDGAPSDTVRLLKHDDGTLGLFDEADRDEAEQP
jgi:hypothetical protein